MSLDFYSSNRSQFSCSCILSKRTRFCRVFIPSATSETSVVPSHTFFVQKWASRYQGWPAFASVPFRMALNLSISQSMTWLSSIAFFSFFTTSLSFSSLLFPKSSLTAAESMALLAKLYPTSSFRFSLTVQVSWAFFFCNLCTYYAFCITDSSFYCSCTSSPTSDLNFSRVSSISSVFWRLL